MTTPHDLTNPSQVLGNTDSKNIAHDILSPIVNGDSLPTKSTAGALSIEQDTLKNWSQLAPKDLTSLGTEISSKPAVNITKVTPLNQNLPIQSLVIGGPVRQFKAPLAQSITITNNSSDNLLGLPVGSKVNVSGTSRQDYQKGSIFTSTAGTFTVAGAISTEYRTQASILGTPTGNAIPLNSSGVAILPTAGTPYEWRQDFKGGTIVQVNGSNQAYTISGKFLDRYYKADLPPFTPGMVVKAIYIDPFSQATRAFGAPTVDRYQFAGGTRQDFKQGIIFDTAKGTFGVMGDIGKYYLEKIGKDANILGLATGEAVKLASGGERQDFDKGSIFRLSNGTFSLQGSLNATFKGLSTADQQRLGTPTANETSAGNYWHQSFQNGELQLVQGQPVKWSNSFLISERYSQLTGANALGKAVGTASNINGGVVQNYEKGSISANGNQALVVKGAIDSFYRQNAKTLGLATSGEVTTSYGSSQIFQGALVLNSAQFGTHTLRGSLVGYYTGLTADQKTQLGALSTEEAVGGDGNWQQFFKGGSILWKSNGTGELKLTPFTIGSDGTKFNVAFTTQFNQVTGWDALGKPTGNVRSIPDGTVQDFEKGSIFQSGAGTFAVRGSIGSYYRANSTALGLPITEEIGTSYGWRQDFANNKTLIHSPQFGTQVLQNSLGGYYRGLSEIQRNQLGAAYTAEKDLSGGNWRQFFKGGTVEWKNNGTGEVKLTPSFSIGLAVNTVNNDFIDKFNSVDGWNSLGNPTSDIKTVGSAAVQDFQKGSIIKVGTVITVLQGAIGGYYASNSSQLGLPIGIQRDLGNGKTQQEFNKGVVFNSPSGVSALYGDVAKTYLDFSQLGIPVGKAIDVGNGITRQNLENGAIFTSIKFGTHGVANDFWTLYKGLTAAQQQDFGMPISDPISSKSGGTNQIFQGGFISLNSDYGNHVVAGRINSYYQTLTEDQRNKLEIPTTDEISDGNGATYQFFKGGLIKQTISNGQVVSSNILSPFTIGYAGSRIADSVIKAYVKLADNLGTPTGKTLGINTGYLQDFDLRMLSVLPTGEGFAITQNIEDYIRSDRGTGFGLATGEGIGQYYGSQMGSSQTFQNGKVFYHPQFGTHGVLGNAQSPGSLGHYYETVLTPTQRGQLGVATSEQIQDGNLKEHQSFQGGTIYSEYNSSTGVVYRFSTESYQPPQASGGGGVIFIGAGGNNNNNNNSSQNNVSSSNGVITINLTPSGGNNNNNNSNQSNVSNNNIVITTPSIPTNIWKAEYFNNNSLNGSPTFTKEENQINNDWGSGGPGNGIGNDNFSVRWQGQFPFEGGNYRFTNSVDDGMRIYVDNNLVHDTWNGRNAVTFNTDVPISTGMHTIKVEYREDGGDAQAKFSLARITPAPTAPTPSPTANYVPYTIKAGETLSGIAQSQLGGASQWTKITNANGNSFTEQQASVIQIGQVVYLPKSGNSSTPIYTPPAPVNNPSTPVANNTVPIYPKDFYGVVMSTTGVNLRNSPNLNDRSNNNRAYNQVLRFDAVTTGDSVTDLFKQKSDNQWYRIAGTNEWVPSGYIDGEPGRSVTTPFTPNSSIKNPLDPIPVPNNSLSPIIYPNTTVSFEYEKIRNLSDEKRVSKIIGQYLVEGISKVSTSGKIINTGSGSLTIGNEDLVKINSLYNGISFKWDASYRPSLSVGDETSDFNLGINGNLFTGKLYSETSTAIKKNNLIQNAGVEIAVKGEFDGRYHRALYGSPLEKIFEFARIIVTSGEDQYVASKVLLEQYPDVGGYIINIAQQPVNVYLGAEALKLAVVGAIGVAVVGIGVASAAVISTLVGSALQSA